MAIREHAVALGLHEWEGGGRSHGHRPFPPPRARPLLGAAERGWTAHTSQKMTRRASELHHRRLGPSPQRRDHTLGTSAGRTRSRSCCARKRQSPFSMGLTARIGLVQEITLMGLFNNRAAGCPKESWALSQEFPGWLVARWQGRSQGRAGLGEQVC